MAKKPIASLFASSQTQCMNFITILFGFIILIGQYSHASGELCNVKFPTIGTYQPLSGDDYRTLKTKESPQNSFVPQYNGYHRFFVDLNNIDNFLVLKSVSADLSDTAKQEEFKKTEFQGISTSYAGLLKTINIENNTGDLKGFSVFYNLNSSPDSFTRFNYYYINSACALYSIGIEKSGSVENKLNSELQAIINAGIKSAAPAATQHKNRFVTFIKIFMIAFIDVSILVLIMFVLRKYVFNGRNPRFAKKFIVIRRIAARMFEGYLYIHITKFTEKLLTDVFLIDPHLVQKIIFIFVIGLFTLISVYLIKKFGQTPGRYAFNIKVVDYKSEQLLSLNKSVIRDIPQYFLWFASALAAWSDTNLLATGKPSINDMSLQIQIFVAAFGVYFVFSTFEFVFCLFNSDRRTVRDLMAQSKVIPTELI